MAKRPMKRAARAETVREARGAVRDDGRNRLQVVQGGWDPANGRGDATRATSRRSRPRAKARNSSSRPSTCTTLVLALGPAGTGKTYLAIAKAVEALEAGKVGRIVLSRPAVEAGESLGFLPGAMEDKLAPYLRPLYDALADRLSPKRLKSLMAEGLIEIAPVGFMRGTHAEQRLRGDRRGAELHVRTDQDAAHASRLAFDDGGHGRSRTGPICCRNCRVSPTPPNVSTGLADISVVRLARTGHRASPAGREDADGSLGAVNRDSRSISRISNWLEGRISRIERSGCIRLHLAFRRSGPASSRRRAALRSTRVFRRRPRTRSMRRWACPREIRARGCCDHRCVPPAARRVRACRGCAPPSGRRAASVVVAARARRRPRLRPLPQDRACRRTCIRHRPQPHRRRSPRSPPYARHSTHAPPRVSGADHAWLRLRRRLRVARVA